MSFFVAQLMNIFVLINYKNWYAQNKISCRKNAQFFTITSNIFTQNKYDNIIKREALKLTNQYSRYAK